MDTIKSAGVVAVVFPLIALAQLFAVGVACIVAFFAIRKLFTGSFFDNAKKKVGQFKKDVNAEVTRLENQQAVNKVPV